LAPFADPIRKVDAALGIGKDFYAVASVLVGCPAEDRPQRNSFDEKRIHTIDRGGEES
jgi:hypothetical protein